MVKLAMGPALLSPAAKMQIANQWVEVRTGCSSRWQLHWKGSRTKRRREAVSVAKSLIGSTAPYTKLVKACRRAIASRLPTDLVRLRIRPCVHRFMYFVQVGRPLSVKSRTYSRARKGRMLPHAICLSSAFSILDVRIWFSGAWFTTELQPLWGHQRGERMSWISTTIKAGKRPSCIFSYV